MNAPLLGGRRLFLGDIPGHTRATLPHTPELAERLAAAEVGETVDVRDLLVYEPGCPDTPCTSPNCPWQAVADAMGGAGPVG